jgi:hypothetical protein
VGPRAVEKASERDGLSEVTAGPALDIALHRAGAEPDGATVGDLDVSLHPDAVPDARCVPGDLDVVVGEAIVRTP